MHILQGDLILHKRTLEPIKTVIYGLRRYDVDRVLALKEHVDPSTKLEGYMSHKSKIYLVRPYLFQYRHRADRLGCYSAYGGRGCVASYYFRPMSMTTWTIS